MNIRKLLNRSLTMAIFTATFSISAHAVDFRDFREKPEDRARDLVEHMTMIEKIRQMTNKTPAIPRLGIPAYDYWTEALHGTVAPIRTTVFPQAIGLAAAWDTDLMKDVATAISDEARAAFNTTGNMGSGSGMGLTLWAPNINIFRDPRWGRGQETYGEDPFLTSRLAVAYIQGLQGDDPHYWKTIATPKHFAVHSGPEDRRYQFDAQPSTYDLYDTYLPAFQAAITEGHAHSIMCSYNAINGVPACANHWLLQTLLRDTWGFDGYVITDQYALTTMYWKMGYASSETEAPSLAISAGTDISIGPENWLLGVDYLDGAVDAKLIDQALVRLFTARIKLGLFDPPKMVPYSKLGKDDIDNKDHRELARKAARESIVLLKNDGILPLTNVKQVTLAGSFADTSDVLFGNYNGLPSKFMTVLAALTKKLGKERLSFTRTIPETVKAAKKSELTVVALGISPKDEGEMHDRTRIEIPERQVELLRALQKQGSKVVVLLFGGSAQSFPPDLADAVLDAWYPGEEGGGAIVDVLFGEFNPSGRLPVTFYRATTDLPDFSDYDMTHDHTYRYFSKPVLYPFGYGLSYSDFRYSGLHLERKKLHPDDQLKFSFQIQNSGPRDGDEVYQVYLSGPEGYQPAPRVALKAFARIHLEDEGAQTVSLTFDKTQLASVLPDGTRKVLPGRYHLWVGGRSPRAENENGFLESDFKIRLPSDDDKDADVLEVSGQ